MNYRCLAWLWNNGGSWRVVMLSYFNVISFRTPKLSLAFVLTLFPCGRPGRNNSNSGTDGRKRKQKKALCLQQCLKIFALDTSQEFHVPRSLLVWYFISPPVDCVREFPLRTTEHQRKQREVQGSHRRRSFSIKEDWCCKGEYYILKRPFINSQWDWDK